MATTEQKFNYGLNIFFAPKEVRDPGAAFALPEITGPARVDVAADGEGVSIRVPKGVTPDRPIRIRLKGAARIAVAVEAGADAAFLEEGSAGRLELDMALGADARVRYASIREGGVEYAERRASVGADASLTWASSRLGGEFAYERTSSRLIGRGGRVIERAMFFGGGADRFDLYSEVSHEAEATVSDLLTVGALAGKAKAIARGLINIKKGARACTGRQKEATLLMSPEAEADAVPMLEIANHDVRCSHSASTGRLDDEKLFYLMSRGLDRRTAVAQYLKGFFAPVAELCGPGFVEALEGHLIKSV